MRDKSISDGLKAVGERIDKLDDMPIFQQPKEAVSIMRDLLGSIQIMATEMEANR